MLNYDYLKSRELRYMRSEEIFKQGVRDSYLLYHV